MNNSIATANPTTTADPVVLNNWKDFQVGHHYNLNVFRQLWCGSTNNHTKVGMMNVSGKLVRIERYDYTNELYARVIDRHKFIFETDEVDEEGNPVLFETGRWLILSAYHYDPSNLALGSYPVFDQMPNIYKDV